MDNKVIKTRITEGLVKSKISHYEFYDEDSEEANSVNCTCWDGHNRIYDITIDEEHRFYIRQCDIGELIFQGIIYNDNQLDVIPDIIEMVLRDD